MRLLDLLGKWLRGDETPLTHQPLARPAPRFDKGEVMEWWEEFCNQTGLQGRKFTSRRDGTDDSEKLRQVFAFGSEKASFAVEVHHPAFLGKPAEPCPPLDTLPVSVARTDDRIVIMIRGVSEAEKTFLRPENLAAGGDYDNVPPVGLVRDGRPVSLTGVSGDVRLSPLPVRNRPVAPGGRPTPGYGDMLMVLIEFRPVPTEQVADPHAPFSNSMRVFIRPSGIQGWYSGPDGSVHRLAADSLDLRHGDRRWWENFLGSLSKMMSVAERQAQATGRPLPLSVTMQDPLYIARYGDGGFFETPPPKTWSRNSPPPASPGPQG
ncbi:MAG: hypothetical protein M3O22_04170 [Pseudomonadota bacterium]|nr:hypothetical protein [Pseudomonadota bacterium]